MGNWCKWDCLVVSRKRRPDDTTRISWCGFKYADSDPLFAVREDIRKYCGLEALVTDPSTRKSELMYLGDAFDDAWVRNKVINLVKWEFTGSINTQYTADGAVLPTAGIIASAPQGTSTACAGCLGAKCDGQTTICNSGLTCLSPDGICSDEACNWGCTGWSCSASVPCQNPNTCVNGVCKA
ncbi:hypothetical protein B0T10DRAFT_466325 [Thelonectria olida]|uniref:Uncharacterized protein n=1 Tax=Thelonectria olida TaxID=1576542 RepID=A0A9P8VUC3_9HYPO|nr:hypothetical protein B0T10DRAFT_466325 [Thelonectria olida]